MGAGIWPKICSSRHEFALAVDNYLAHPIADGLKGIELIFLPPNTTSKNQLMVQGVIRSLKAIQLLSCTLQALIEEDLL